MAEESKVGLLEKVGYSDNYQENCGGCEIQRRKATQPGPPWKLLSAVWVIVLVNGTIRDFHVAKQEEDIGYYGGLVGSAFMLGRALTSVAWGVIADKYGRKPVIMLGTVAAVIFNTLFGFSVNISMAVTSRFLLGALNGMFGPIRMTTAWGIGLVIGPALGGLLAQESLHVHKLPSSPEHDMEDPTSTSDDATGDYGGKVEERPTNSKKSLYKNWALMSSIIVYCVFSLHDMAYTEAQEQRGAANGISLTTMSICKTIGPAFGGSLLSWAEKRKTAAFLPGIPSIRPASNVLLV
ncbi:hypothetical protein Cgig2_005432 [Carnegiea gigantea]|uniref:Major facilitator superfamily (MFS) profile domain-containing protein n=1 Tax=Carnegiea gigantea TaxID=171969 RepID=A0A9Q1QGJ1_9CARY|nr:hypothetical protein Cgig2_005432 [Carnegiea gigantea]